MRKEKSIIFLIFVLVLGQILLVNALPQLKLNVCKGYNLSNNLTLNTNETLTNLTGNINLFCNNTYLDDDSIFFNVTNSSHVVPDGAVLMQVVYYNGSLYLLPDNLSDYYNKYETDNLYMNRADWLNFRNITLANYVTLDDYGTIKNMTLNGTTNLTQLRSDVDSLKTGDSGFTFIWKLTLIITAIVSVVSLILVSRVLVAG